MTEELIEELAGIKEYFGVDLTEAEYLVWRKEMDEWLEYFSTMEMPA